MKITDFKYTSDDIITTDGYLNFCNDNNICYIKTDFFYTGKFNWRGQDHPKFIDKVCVIGHSDYPITDQISMKFEKVFCTNKNTQNSNTFALPLGLTNDCDDSTLHRVYGNKKIVVECANSLTEKSNLVYMNFNISNFPQERHFLFEKFNREKWVKVGQIENTVEGRIKFLRDIKVSKFVLCPRGNGVDTHRLWETLYMGSIPIVKYHETHHLIQDLPILFVENWEEVTEDFLNQKYEEMINKNWNMDKLKLSYWTNFIKSELKNEYLG